MGSFFIPAIPGLNRSEELEKQGVPVSLASSKIAIASASVPATGLSMKTGLLAWKTGRACSRWGRPSTLSSRTTSTFLSRSSIESTISTPNLSRSSLGVAGDAVAAGGDVGAPAGVGRHDPDAGQLARRLGVVEHLREGGHVRGVQADDPRAERLVGLRGFTGQGRERFTLRSAIRTIRARLRIR